jgi:hypothetical protein
MGATNKRRLHVLFGRRLVDAVADVAAEDETTQSEILRRAVLELLHRRRPALFAPPKRGDRNVE